MSCGRCQCNPCRCSSNTCSDNEPLASVVQNFQDNIIGAVVATCDNGIWSWTLPCELDDGDPEFPRLAGESVLCYFLRYLEFNRQNVPAGALIAANNLSDLENLATALSNLGLVIGVDVQAWNALLDIWAGIAAPGSAVVGINDVQTLAFKTLKNPAATSQNLTDQASIAWNANNGEFAIVTLGGNRTMAAPSNLKVGTYVLKVIQDGVGSRTLAYNAVFKWAAGVAPVLSTGIGAVDILTFVCDGTNLYGVAQLNFS